MAFSVMAVTACDRAGTTTSAASADEHELIGVQAPPFELPKPAGGSVSLSDYAGKVVVVDFWATWCEPCRDSFPFYQSLVDQHGGQVVVVGVSVDEEPDGIAGFVTETGAKFPVVWDETQGVAHQYEPKTMPTSYIIDKAGIVRFVHSGFQPSDAEHISAMVRELL